MNGQVTYRMLLCGTALIIGTLTAGWAETPLAARGGDETTTGPRIEFSALEHDFGEAASSVDLETTFTFKNAGDQVLIIEKVKGG